MNNERQPSQLANHTPSDTMATLEGASTESQPLLPPATESHNQWQQISARVSEFWERSLVYITSFWNYYRSAIISVLFIFAALVALRLLLAVLDAINSIPLVSPTLELIGLGYTTWFTFRYLIQASTRQELAAIIRSYQKEVLDQ